MTNPTAAEQQRAVEIVKGLDWNKFKSLAPKSLAATIAQFAADTRAETIKAVRDAIEGQRNPLPQPDTPRGVSGDVWQEYLIRNAYRNEVLNQVAAAIDAAAKELN